MTHYLDLAPCDYYFPVGHGGAFAAVGWLGSGRRYPKGRLTRQEHDSLVSLSHKPYVPVSTRGRHRCELSRPAFLLLPCFRALSNKDLFIPYGSRVFVAPGGILHYIEVHHYLPPEVFRRAVVECPPMGSKAYFAALRRTDWARVEPQAVPSDETVEREHFALGNKSESELIRQYGLAGYLHRLDFALGAMTLSEFEREYGHLEPASESNQSPPGDAFIQDQDTMPLTARVKAWLQRTWTGFCL